MEFDIAVKRVDDAVILRPSGWFIYDVVPTFRAKVEDLLKDGARKMVVDLQGVSFMDSAGVGALVSALTSLRKRGGKLALANLSPEVQRVLEITRLLKLFDVYEDVEKALTV